MNPLLVRNFDNGVSIGIEGNFSVIVNTQVDENKCVYIYIYI